MSATKKSDLLRYKQNKSISDYTLLFLSDYYHRASFIQFDENDKLEVLSVLDIDTNYQIDELIRTMLMSYATESFMSEPEVRQSLMFYKMFNHISLLHYNEFIAML